MLEENAFKMQYLCKFLLEFLKIFFGVKYVIIDNTKLILWSPGKQIRRESKPALKNSPFHKEGYLRHIEILISKLLNLEKTFAIYT